MDHIFKSRDHPDVTGKSGKVFIIGIYAENGDYVGLELGEQTFSSVLGQMKAAMQDNDDNHHVQLQRLVSLHWPFFRSET